MLGGWLGFGFGEEHEVDEEDGDEDEGAYDDVFGFDTEAAFFAWGVGRWEVAGDVLVIMHGSRVVFVGATCGRVGETLGFIRRGRVGP